jgi:hypothetical protein
MIACILFQQLAAKEFLASTERMAREILLSSTRVFGIWGANDNFCVLGGVWNINTGLVFTGTTSLALSATVSAAVAALVM